MRGGVGGCWRQAGRKGRGFARSENERTTLAHGAALDSQQSARLIWELPGADRMNDERKGLDCGWVESVLLAGSKVLGRLSSLGTKKATQQNRGEPAGMTGP